VAAYLGFGTAHATSSSSQIETFGGGVLYRTPNLGGLFAGVGGSVFFNRHLGVGAEVFGKPSNSDYAGIEYRASFYNFDAIYRPGKPATNRFVPELRAGIGGAHVTYEFDDQQACDNVPGCPSSRHFQAHMGVAARAYLNGHVFFRPAVDVHFVNGLSDFGSHWVPRYTVSIGFSLGRE
jgi:hypothetical protein